MGKTYVGNTSNKSKLPKKIYIGNSSNKSVVCKAIYVGNSSNKSVEVWRNTSLPSAYQKVEYIYNSEYTQYIDTGVVPDYYTTTIVEVEYPDITSYGVIFGSHFSSASSTAPNYQLDLANSPPARHYYMFRTTTNSMGSNAEADTRYKIIFNDSGKFYINGTLVYSTTDTFTVPSSMPTMPLFAQKEVYGSSTGLYLSNKVFRLYHFAVKKNGIYIRDMYPCYRISDTAIGMYDLVNSRFYANAGTGIFGKGPNV